MTIIHMDYRSGKKSLTEVQVLRVSVQDRKLSMEYMLTNGRQN